MPTKPDGTILIDSKLDPKGFNQGVKNLSGNLSPLLGLVSKLGLAIAGALSIKLVADFTASVTKLSAEFERLQISALAVGQLHGIAGEETKGLISQLTQSGVQSDIANRAFINFAQNGLEANLLPALAKGAQDLAVFAGTGETSSDILDRLSDGILTLNTLMLRRANVAIDVNEVEKQYAKNLGLTTEQLTIQQKRHAVTLAVLEKLKDVQGLYALSQKTAAGQLSSNTRIMNEFRAAIGGAFQGAFYKLIKGWNDLIKVMTASLREGGKLYDMFLKIGTIAAFLADIIVGLFRAIAALFGVDLSKAVNTASGSLDENASSASGAAEAQSELAAATEKAGKAAKGALASFDDLNVLQQDTADLEGPSTEDTGFPTTEASDFSGLLEEIEAKQKALQDRVDALKAKFLDFIQPVAEAFQTFVAPAIQRIIDLLGPALSWVWENILKPFVDWIVTELGPKALDVLGVFLDILGLNLEALSPIIESLWNSYLKPFFAWLGEVAIKALDWMGERLRELRGWIANNQEAWSLILVILFAAVAAFALIASGVGVVAFLLGGLIYIVANAGEAWKIFVDLVKLGFSIISNLGRIAFEKFTEGIRTAFIGVKNFVKGIFNDIIGFLNGMLSRATQGINSIVNSVNSVGGILPGYIPVSTVSAPQIPYLATGAVIPPNARFTAVLGDQTAGRNLEAPESLIRSIIRDEIGEISANVSIKFDGSMAQLVQLLKPAIDRETVRVGNSLVKSGVTL